MRPDVPPREASRGPALVTNEVGHTARWRADHVIKPALHRPPQTTCTWRFHPRSRDALGCCSTALSSIQVTWGLHVVKADASPAFPNRLPLSRSCGVRDLVLLRTRSRRLRRTKIRTKDALLHSLPAGAAPALSAALSLNLARARMSRRRPSSSSRRYGRLRSHEARDHGAYSACSLLIPLRVPALRRRVQCHLDRPHPLTRRSRTPAVPPSVGRPESERDSREPGNRLRSSSLPALRWRLRRPPDHPAPMSMRARAHRSSAARSNGRDVEPDDRGEHISRHVPFTSSSPALRWPLR